MESPRGRLAGAMDSSSWRARVSQSESEGGGLALDVLIGAGEECDAALQHPDDDGTVLYDGLSQLGGIAGETALKKLLADDGISGGR
jgi:hypothetical protein